MITITWEGLDEAHKAMEELRALARSGAVAYIGTNLVDPPYPYFLEYGTSRMPAYPAARPAFDQRKGEAVDVAADVLGQLILSGRRDARVFSAVAQAAAQPIANRWRELARVRTGTYRRSIDIEVRQVADVGGELA